MGDERAKLALEREDIEKNAGPETVEAFDVWAHYRAADKAGMGVEWFETFLNEMRNGRAPVEAAANACYEWDV